ncbi:MAG TPA: hemerythrin domain-containing protein [Polyangiales bacterium]|nr:hemerythrin domain-containing protein [Polyangiales bacterium]
MNIYEALSEDHRKFEQLLDGIVSSSKADDDKWKALLDQLRIELIAHAHAEESVLYNALREEDTAKHLVAHAYGEHATAEGEIRTLTLAKMVDQTWTGLAEKLSKDLRHHIEEEESEVFAAARKVFTDAEAKQLGAAFERLKTEMLPDGDSIMASTIDLVANLLPPRLSQRFRQAEAKTLGRDSLAP